MTYNTHFTLTASRFGQARLHAARPAIQPRGAPRATLTRDELQREVIAILG
ncbi:hypothetical protein [Novosphingobium sp. B 225]|uniref:hypothetical protein n=1 Tax=Novosphingobium sp. B 225 TaxID=1961849 RepID=UPI0015959924|nr:hypothetical protein [Novosphingobium sp. B 225]